MTIEQTLQKIGLEEKEAKIYLATLELGSSTVLEIAKKSGIKRPTCYVILDELAAKGYVKKEACAAKTTFSAEEPERLLALVQARESALKDALPFLQAIQAGKKEKPKISVYEGTEGMLQLYGQIYLSNEIWWYSCIRDLNIAFPTILKDWLEVIKKKQTRVRELITSNPDDLAYAQDALKTDANAEVRIVPDTLPVRLDMALFDNKVAIFTLKKNIFALVIESEDVVESFRSLYQLAWSAATPVQEFIKKNPL